MAPELPIPDPPLEATPSRCGRGGPATPSGCEPRQTTPSCGAIARQSPRFSHHRNRDAMVSWWLAAAGRARGLGRASVAALARWAFEELGIERLAASIEEENAPSRRLAERCGFQMEGRLRSSLGNGTRVDCLSYGLLPGELRGID